MRHGSLAGLSAPGLVALAGVAFLWSTTLGPAPKVGTAPSPSPAPAAVTGEGK